jgi:hypothetical protein
MANLSSHAKLVLQILRDSPEPLSAAEITYQWQARFADDPLPYGGVEMILLRIRPYLIEKSGKYAARAEVEHAAAEPGQGS